jgi:hypothetical protein
MNTCLRSLGLAAAVLALVGCAAPRAVAPGGTASPAPPGTPSAPATTAPAPPSACAAPGWTAAAAANGASLDVLAWAPFGRAETGWQAYVPLVQHEAATACPPDSEGFAAALAAWQARQGLAPDGTFTEALFAGLKAAVQARRPFVGVIAAGRCPETPDVIAAVSPQEGLGKPAWLRPGALAAYRRMVAAARAGVPQVAADPDVLAIFSGYRSPSLDAARCAAEGNCDGIVRARCSAHRTGLALDLYLGHAEGYMADSTADPNRLYLSRTPAYRWLLANAGRFGFVNYPFEPWHWEWTGEAP